MHGVHVHNFLFLSKWGLNKQGFQLLSVVKIAPSMKAVIQSEQASVSGILLNPFFFWSETGLGWCTDRCDSNTLLRNDCGWSQKTKLPDMCYNMSPVCWWINKETKVIMAFVFLLFKKRDILKWYSVWPVYLKVILATEYTLLPIAKGSLITNQSGLEQTFALTLILLRYSASHAVQTWPTFQTWYDYQDINAWKHILYLYRYFVWTIQNTKIKRISPKTFLMF